VVLVAALPASVVAQTSRQGRTRNAGNRNPKSEANPKPESRKASAPNPQLAAMRQTAGESKAGHSVRHRQPRSRWA
jgi:hypothetical protein